MISILIVSYEARGHLRHCLERVGDLRRAGDFDGEVLVIDNASTDGSPEMVASEFPDCRLLRLDANVGFGAANNRAAETARGDQLLLLNSDAWLAADGSLPHLHERLAGDARLGLAVPQVYYPDGRPQFVWCPESGVLGEALQMARNRFEHRAAAHRQLRTLLLAVTGPGWYSASCMLVKKSAFDAVGGFDEDFFLYFEDVDLSRRLRLQGFGGTLVHDATAFHVKGGSSRSHKSEVAYRQAQLLYYRKHRPAWEYRYLRRRMRRKFARVPEPERRRELQALLES